MAGTPQGYPVNFPAGQRNQVHHSFIWLNSLVALVTAGLVGVASNATNLVPLLMELGGGGAGIAWGIIIVLAGILVTYGVIAVISYLFYRNLFFVFEEKEFSLYSGIFVKRHVHVPYARVQSVNHRQSFVQRIAGVCTVEVDTAGGASNKAVHVPYVPLGTGEAIRHDLFVRKAASLAHAEDLVYVADPSRMGAAAVPAQAPNAPGAQGQPSLPLSGSMEAQGMQGAVPVAGGMAGQPGVAASGNVLDATIGGLAADFRGIYGEEVAGMEPVSFERRLDNKELLLASVSHSGVAAAAVVLIVTFAATALGISAFEVENTWAGVLLVPLLGFLFVLSLALSVGSVALSFGNFSVRRRGSRIEVERGILQRDFSGIDIDRIQSLVVKQSFVRRLLGYCEVSVGRISAGGAEDQNTQARLNSAGLVLHPFLKAESVDELVGSLLPEYADRPTSGDFKGLPDVALRRGIVRRSIWRNSLFWSALFIGVCQVVFNVGFAGMVAQQGGQRVVDYVNGSCVALYVLLVVEVVFVVVGTVWWKRGSGFALNERYAALCNDGLATETVYFPRSKVQNFATRTNPFQRASGVTTISALTAAGAGGSHTALWDVDASDGAAWLDWLKPRTVREGSGEPARDNL